MELTALSLTEAADLIRRREISAVEYAQALLDSIASHGDLAAFITVSADALLADARRADALTRTRHASLGPLHGVPLAVKDNIDTLDLPTTGGTPSLRGHRPTRDAAVVHAVRSTGALVLGKTNLHELAYGITSDNAAFGAVRNPYDRGRIAGGSSGGTAAAVSARLAPAGLGTDTGGSVRIPAALCGVAGLRPTMGRYSQEGIILVSTTRDTAGPLARSVAELAVLDAALTGTGTPLPEPVDLHGLRLGVIRDPFWAGLPDDLTRVLEARCAELESQGAHVVDVELPEHAHELIVQTGIPIAFHETPLTLRAYLDSWPTAPSLTDVVEQCASPDVREILSGICGKDGIPVHVYRDAITVHRPALQDVFRDLFAAHRLAALISPTTPLTAVPVGTQEARLGEERIPLFPAYTRTTGPGSATGCPGLTLPAGLDDSGLPIGLALDGLPGSDRTLLSIGQACERVFGLLPRPTQ
ncbi:indoleacetamide hydrolase [Sphaerisporangium sp. NPDC051017]|uniref:indoleacetamide hydrolase n=1 Tax=Sphaerisporangium sp. NPDC051017 TaxID=3154636 RepID=UPI00342F2329